MKHLKSFENVNFKPGDYVKCIDDTNNKLLTIDNVYLIDTIKEYGTIKKYGTDDNMYIYFKNYTPGFFAYRFTLATPKEIEQYKLEQNINNYSL